MQVVQKKVSKGNTIVFCSTTCYRGDSPAFQSLLADLDNINNNKNNNDSSYNNKNKNKKIKSYNREEGNQEEEDGKIILIERYKKAHKEDALIEGEAAVMFIGKQ